MHHFHAFRHSSLRRFTKYTQLEKAQTVDQVDSDSDPEGDEPTVSQLLRRTPTVPEADLILRIKAHPEEAHQVTKRSHRLPLHLASLSSSAAVVQELLAAFPAGVKAKDRWGRYPIHGSVHDVEIVALLLAAHPPGSREMDWAGRLPLHLALTHPLSKKSAKKQGARVKGALGPASCPPGRFRTAPSHPLVHTPSHPPSAHILQMQARVPGKRRTRVCARQVCWRRSLRRTLELFGN